MDDVSYSQVWWDPETGAERHTGTAECKGTCLRGYDILSPSDGVPASVLSEVAYPDPSCPQHGNIEPWPDPIACQAACDQQRAKLLLAYEQGRMALGG